MRMAFFSTQKFETPFFDAKKPCHIDYFNFSLNFKTAQVLDGQSVVCVFVNDKIDKACVKVLEKKRVQLIALRCSGFNNVDLEACRQAKIQVIHVPQYSPHAVAEHALALLLCLNRKIHKAYTRIKEGNFELNGLQGYDLYHKTVGIIGMGAIGQVFAKICRGLGCKILAYDPKQFDMPDVTWTDLKTIFKKSDVISLHCPLNTSTKHIINIESLKLMKKNLLLINTGRGALIDSKALTHALKKQWIAGVALDAYELESEIFYYDHSLDIIQDDILMRLTTFPNVIITSHQGFLTHEALEHIAHITIENIKLFEQGKKCRHRIDE